MPSYTVTSEDGRTFKISGDSPPNPEDIQAIVARLDEQSGQISKVNQDVGALESGAIAAGRGLATIARGMGLMEPEDPTVTSAFTDLQKRHPVSTAVGEIAGQAAPFVLPGVGVGAIPAAGGRIAGAGILGALEGGLINRGEGGDTGDVTGGALSGGAIAGSIEAALPYVGRLAGKLIKKYRGRAPSGALFNSAGEPTDELKAAMEAVGVTLQDLADESVYVLKQVEKGIDPEDAIRKTRFDELEMPATQGDITQDFAQQAKEERLVSMAGAEAGEPLRQVRLDQSQIFQQRVDEFVDSLGAPQETGDSVKDALTGRLDDLKSKKNDLYKEFAQTSQQAQKTPLFTDSIIEALPPKAELRRLSRLQGNNIDAIKDLLVEFGVVQEKEAVEQFTKSGGEVIPLNLGNFEEFRQALNQLIGGQTPGEKATAGVARRLINALDGEIDTVEKSLLDVEGAANIEALREARQIVAQTKKEFSPQSIVGRLTSTKADNVTPLIESSKVYDAILSPRAPVENLERTVDSLLNSGAKGKQAIKNLQATAVMRALDDALRATSRKTSGIQTVGYPMFVKSLNKIGDERLALLFKSNPQDLARLRRIKGVAEDLIPAAGATPRGSAPVILDIARKLGRAPGIAAVVDLTNYIVRAGADERTVAKALNANPRRKKAALLIQSEYPAIASALGISAINLEDTED